MNELKATFALEEQEPIRATFKINLTPYKLSQFENDMGFVRKDEVITPDIDLSNLATKDELAQGLETKQPKGDYASFDDIPDISNLATKNELTKKANDGEVVHLTNTETISGAKTFTQPIKIQNGAGTGSLIIGGDTNAGTLTNGTRKLARVAVPTQSNKDLSAILLGFDSNGDDALKIKNNTYDAISFGGQTKITNATSPMSLGFCVTKTRNSTSASDKVYTLEMDSSEARFNVQPNYNGVNLATTVDITNALNGYAKLTDIPDVSKLATKDEIPTYTAGENITIENGVISANVPDIPQGGDSELNVSAPIVFGGLKTSTDNISVDNNGKCYLNSNAYYATIEECLPTEPVAGLESPRSSFYDTEYTNSNCRFSFYKLKGYTDKYPMLNLEGYNAILHKFSVGDIVMADSIKPYNGNYNDVQMCFGKIEDDGTFVPKLMCMAFGWSDSSQFAKISLLHTPSEANKREQQQRYSSCFVANYITEESRTKLSYKKQNELSNIANIRGVKFIEKDGAVSVAWVRENGEIVELSDSGIFSEIDFNCVVFNGYVSDVEKTDIGIYGFDSSKYFVAKDTIDNVVVRMTDGTGFSAYSLNYEKEDFAVVDNKLSLKTKMQLITQTDYDSLTTKEPNTLYLIEE